MNILTERLLVVRFDGQELTVDLAEMLALLAQDRVDDLPFLRPHQRAPWHSFCVQTSALALYQAGLDAPPTDPETWRGLLRALTRDWPGDEPWRLVVEDVTQPAFLQAPIPEGMADPHRNEVTTPDDLDVLVSSRNHGLKQGMAAEAGPAVWIAALVALQTTAGSYGSGNYGIARMNRGFATRPLIGLVPPGGLGARWRRDVTVLLQKRAWFFERVDEFMPEDGLSLLWCQPWDGKTSLELSQLDPWFVEICRRVRLRLNPLGGITAQTARSEATRVAAKERNGNVGDPWTPIRMTDSAAYNAKPTYAVMSAVLFDRGEWLCPLLLDWHPGIDPPVVTALFDVVSRGQGVTEGHHLRRVAFQGERPLGLLRLRQERDLAAKLSKEMVQQVKELRKILSIALLTLTQGAPDKIEFKKHASVAWVAPWLQAVEDRVEPVFFDHLFAQAEAGQDAEQRWLEQLRKIGWDIFGSARGALPVTGSRRLKAVAIAESKLHGLLRQSFGTASDKETSHAA